MRGRMRREKPQMLGDFLREAAVLILVFYPLEQYLRGNLDWGTLGWAGAIALLLLWYGMILEGRDEL